MSALVDLDLLVLAPVLAPAAGAVVVLLADVVAPRLARAHFAVAIIALVVGLALAVPGALRAEGRPLLTLCLPAPEGSCLYQAGPLASALQLGALFGAVVVLLLAWPRHSPAAISTDASTSTASTSTASTSTASSGTASSGTASSGTVSSGTASSNTSSGLHGGPAVVVALALAATAGAAAVAAAHDLGSWLVALELATLPVIALVALRGTRAAASGAVSLLVTSLASFALVVLGAALWVVSTGRGTFDADGVAAALAVPERRAVLALAVLLLIGGLGFKLSVVPFHAWTPQAYTGASEPVAAFLSATSKTAALAALVVVLRPLTEAGAPAIAVVGVLAALTMTVGNVLALGQDDPVRLLAWSTVAQAGWVLLPLAALTPASLSAAGGYLLAYVAATLVAFGVVVALGQVGGATTSRDLAAYRGLLRTRPVLGAALGLALLSLAGLPPGIIGLVAKVVALRPVVSEGLWPLAAVAVLNAVIGIAVYLRWFAVLLRDPDESTADTVGSPVALPRGTVAALALSSLVLVLLSLAPQLLLGLLS